MKSLALTLILFYQKYLSLDQGFLGKKVFGGGVQVCRFTPTCSEYTYQAIEKYGIFTGVLLGAWRIVRCNPFSKGGFDPVK